MDTPDENNKTDMTEWNPGNTEALDDEDRKPRRAVHDRLLDAAYSLFTAHGIAQVGIDTVIAKSGCAKASLYNHFGSKEGLAVAVLELREKRWTRDWLEAGILDRADSPEGRLLAVFDLYHEWFNRGDFEGCTFVNALLESEPHSTVNRVAQNHLRNIRDILRGHAEEAGLADTSHFVRLWHMLMKGATVAAVEGNRDAARDARTGAEILLAQWPRLQRPAP